MSKHWIYSVGRAGFWTAALFVLVGSAGGCAMWDKERWNPARYRDERATDIDERLSRTKPIVQNPF